MCICESTRESTCESSTDRLVGYNSRIFLWIWNKNVLTSSLHGELLKSQGGVEMKRMKWTSQMDCPYVSIEKFTL